MIFNVAERTRIPSYFSPIRTSLLYFPEASELRKHRNYGFIEVVEDSCTIINTSSTSRKFMMGFHAPFLRSVMSVMLFLKASSGLKIAPQSRSSFLKSIRMKMSAIPEMDYTTLGSSDLLVSKVCLGTMTWGQQNTEAEGIEQMDVAFNEYGINFMDTAEMYPVPTKPETQGETDRIIAKWLAGRDRSKVILASKVSGASERITWLPGRNGNGARVSKKDIIVSVDESLKRLGTDYIDLVQIHWPDRYVPLFGGGTYDQKLEREYYSFEEQLRAFDDLIKAGKVRHSKLNTHVCFISIVKYLLHVFFLILNPIISETASWCE